MTAKNVELQLVLLLCLQSGEANNKKSRKSAVYEQDTKKGREFEADYFQVSI